MNEHKGYLESKIDKVNDLMHAEVPEEGPEYLTLRLLISSMNTLTFNETIIKLEWSNGYVRVKRRPFGHYNKEEDLERIIDVFHDKLPTALASLMSEHVCLKQTAASGLVAFIIDPAKISDGIRSWIETQLEKYRESGKVPSSLILDLFLGSRSARKSLIRRYPDFAVEVKGSRIRLSNLLGSE